MHTLPFQRLGHRHAAIALIAGLLIFSGCSPRPEPEIKNQPKAETTAGQSPGVVSPAEGSAERSAGDLGDDPSATETHSGQNEASDGPVADLRGTDQQASNPATLPGVSEPDIGQPDVSPDQSTPTGDQAEPEKVEDVIARSFAAPAGAAPLSQARVWINRDRRLVYADGYIATNDGALEMLACPAGTKEHESVIATLGLASEIHAGLLAVGAQVGTPVRYDPSFVPPTGQRIRVWVCYFGSENQFKVVDARQWVLNINTDETLKEDWVFAGSFVYEDPSDGRRYYQGDVGDMICVSNFTTAMLDVPVQSSAETDRLQYIPNTKQIPENGTPVRLIFEPIPLPTDEQPVAPEPSPPTERDLRRP